MPSLNLPGCRISFSTPDAEASALELNGDRTRCLVKCTSAWLYAHLLPDDLAEVGIPTIATTHSDGPRPPVPNDRDQQ